MLVNGSVGACLILAAGVVVVDRVDEGHDSCDAHPCSSCMAGRWQQITRRPAECPKFELVRGLFGRQEVRILGCILPVEWAS